MIFVTEDFVVFFEFCIKLNIQVMVNEEKDILQASFEVPVLVDFWAPWCGPCRFLSPILDELAAEANGRWKLVKVNTDEQPEFMQKYRIQGIPALKLFYGGKIIGEQVGALPKHQLKQWLEELIPTPEKKAWLALQAQLPEIKEEEALKLLHHFLNEYPNHEEAKLRLLGIEVFTNPTIVKPKIEELLKKQPERDDLKDIYALADFLTANFNATTPIDALLEKAREKLQQNNAEEALDNLIESIILNKQAYDEIARKVCVALFHRWGEHHPLTQKYRRRFSMALY